MKENRSDWIGLIVKYKVKCKQCGKDVLPGEYVQWSKISKDIKHIKCVTNDDRSESFQNNSEIELNVLQLECFICERAAGCTKCIFEEDCDRSLVSHACICSECLAAPDPYERYQGKFIKKMQIIGKVKIR